MIFVIQVAMFVQMTALVMLVLLWLICFDAVIFQPIVLATPLVPAMLLLALFFLFYVLHGKCILLFPQHLKYSLVAFLPCPEFSCHFECTGSGGFSML